MSDEQRRLLDDEQVRQRAKEAIRERLTLVSAAIWIIGALLVYLLILEPRHVRPQWGMIAGLALLVPAALPWLVYPRLVGSATRRRMPAGSDAMMEAGSDAQAN